MTIKKLLRSEKEYVDWVKNTFLLPCLSQEQDVWRKEDLPKLEPFFRFSEARERRLMTAEELESFEHYKRCEKEYAQEAFEFKRIIDGFSFPEFLEYFGLCYKETEDEDEDYYSIDGVFFDSENYNLVSKWPAVAVLFIDSGFDRVGDFKGFQLEFVEHEMFEG